jgi:flagellar protein FlbD
MIILTKLNYAQIAVNANLIEFIEETPDTVITLTNNDKIVVKESIADIIEKVVSYHRYLNNLVETEYERQHGAAK